MKLCTFIEDGRERLGVVTGTDVLNAPSDFADMVSLIRAGADGLRRLESGLAKAARRPLSAVKLAPPVRPATMLCSGSNYRDHNKEKANTPISGKEPEYFVKTADCIIGHDDSILYDERLTKKLDAETELAVVIGKPGRHIPVERALEHVFGYTIVNDVTARDRQVRRNEQGFTWYELGRSKCFETSGPTGPWIVTADEIDDPQKLRLRTRINGELRQSSSTANMIFSCAHLIHFFSINMTLPAGTIIITGTPGGTAWSTDPELGGKWVGGDGSEELVPAKGYLKPGDVIECELEKIGVLRNRIATA